MKPKRKHIHITNNTIVIPQAIVQDENLDPKQRYEIEFTDSSIVLKKSTKYNTFKFYVGSGQYRMALKPEHIPDNLRDVFDKSTGLTYETNQNEFIILLPKQTSKPN